MCHDLILFMDCDDETRKWNSDYLDLIEHSNPNYGKSKCFHCLPTAVNAYTRYGY